VTQPLSGVRLVSIALNTPGPLAIARLAAAGARVVKVEPPTGDPLARISPAWYGELHREVRVERIDLKSPDGAARIQALLADSDVFLSSQRPSALHRLGLGAEHLRHLRSVNIVGEQAAPEIPGHDLTYMARAGLIGESMPPSLFADVLGSERAFAAVLLALRQPPGTHIEVGLYDSLDSAVAPHAHGLTAPGGVLGGGLPTYGIYHTRAGRIAIAALEPHFRVRLYELLELPDGSSLADVFATRSAEDWEAWARAHDLPIVVVSQVSG